MRFFLAIFERVWATSASCCRGFEFLSNRFDGVYDAILAVGHFERVLSLVAIRAVQQILI